MMSFSCNWNITVRSGRTIKLTFKKFNLPKLSGVTKCSSSYLLLRNGGSENSPYLEAGKYCGDSIPETLSSSSNKLFLKVFSSSPGRELEILYEEVGVSCGGDVELSKYFNRTKITSPNYPNVPPPHSECVWRVFAPSGETIHFDINDRFDMAYSRNCEKEYLELRDGATDLAPLIGVYCASTPPFKETTGNALYIKYFTDSNDPKDGFSSTVTMSKCGGTIFHGYSGQIASPGFPNNYDENLNCTWRLIAPEGTFYQIDVEIFQMPVYEADTCLEEKDSLKIAFKTKISRENDTLIKEYTFCGSKTNTSIMVSTGNEVLITLTSFKRLSSKQTSKFHISYYATSSFCSENLSGPSGVIMSKGYPIIEGTSYCTIRITAPFGNRVTAVFSDFDVGPDPTTPNHYSGTRVVFYHDHLFSYKISMLNSYKDPGFTVESTGNELGIYYSFPRGSTLRGFKGVYFTNRTAICGGVISGLNGTLSSPEPSLTSFHCKWTYDGKKDTTLSLKIVGHFDPNTFQGCTHGSAILVKRGDNGHKIGEFCDTAERSSPYLILSPYSDVTIEGSKSFSVGDKKVNFTIDWKVNECGKFLTKSEGNILSPNYPQNYPPSVDCAWHIQLPTYGEVIKLHFESFVLDSDCDRDYLTIHNGDSQASPVLLKTCGNIVPADIISQTTDLWIVFHSDAHTEAKGFNISYTPIAQGCGGIFHGFDGIIESQDYPSPYKNNMECEWEIRVEPGYHVGIVFSWRFQIEESTDCVNDFIQVYEMKNTNWVPIGNKLCGRVNPPPVNSTTNSVKILFRSNEKINGDGFRIEWFSNCGGLIDADKNGIIHSPGYPLPYRGPLECNYTISAPGKVIKGVFETFELEEGNPGGGCMYDKVVIFVTLLERSPRKLGTYCGSMIPRDFSTKNRVEIIFTADMSQNFKGFLLKYTFDDCGGNITEESVITSPTYFGQYLPNSNCKWNITAPEDKIIIIKFTSLWLTASSRCQSDYLLVYDGYYNKTNESQGLLGRICGSKRTPYTFRTSSNKGTVIFITDDFHNSADFSASIIFQYGEKIGCGGQVNVGSSTIVQSPEYNGVGFYKPNLDCHWILKAEPLHMIMLKVKQFSLSEKCNTTKESSCNCDYLAIYDGISENSEPVGMFCGSKRPPTTITSSKSFLSMKLVTDELYGDMGFLFEASSKLSPCGEGILNATNEIKELVSPGYPNNYAAIVNCMWVIRSNAWNDIDVHFVDFDIKSTKTCQGSRLEISSRGFGSFYDDDEGPGDDKVIVGRNIMMLPSPSVYMGSRTPYSKTIFCGDETPSDYYSSSSTIKINFISESPETSRGFKLQYSYARCSRNYTQEHGRILKSKLTEDCTILISVNKNVTISLYFSNFAVSMSKDCASTRLEVFDGTSESSRLLSPSCGFLVPKPVFSKTNTVKIKFSTTNRIARGKFDLTYTSTDKGSGCGGRIYNYGGVFSSPNYPGNYRNESVCRWDIQVPGGNVPVIEFTVFDLGRKVTCDKNFVQLFDVSESTVEVLRVTYCGEDKPARFVGNKRTVAVIYTTDVHNDGIGWFARFMSQPG